MPSYSTMYARSPELGGDPSPPPPGPALGLLDQPTAQVECTSDAPPPRDDGEGIPVVEVVAVAA